MRHRRNVVDFLSLGFDPLLDKRFREHAVAHEELVVAFQGVKRILEVAREKMQVTTIPYKVPSFILSFKAEGKARTLSIRLEVDSTKFYECCLHLSCIMLRL